MDSLLLEPDQEFLASMGMLSVDASLLSTKEGNVPVPLKNHFPVAADLEAGTCVGNVIVLTGGQSVEEVAETTTFAEKQSKEPQVFSLINEVTASERADQALELLGLE